MNESLVSVVIPVFNADRYIRSAIESVLSQDYGNIEVIAIDDGSQDNSRSVLAEYTNHAKIIHQNNKGSANARNVGLQHATGEYVAFLDADDVWHPSKTRLQVKEFKLNPGVGLVYNNWIVVEDESIDIDNLLSGVTVPDGRPDIDQSLSGWMYRDMLLDSYVHTSSAIIRRDIIDEVGLFDEFLIKGQDYDYWIRLSRKTQFLKINIELSAYRIQEQGITQVPNPVNYGAIILENAVRKWGRKGPDGRAVSIVAIRNRLSWLWYGFGRLHLSAGNFSLAKTAFRKSLLYAPWRIGALRKYFQSLAKS